VLTIQQSYLRKEWWQAPIARGPEIDLTIMHFKHSSQLQWLEQAAPVSSQARMSSPNCF
jgi:hypothetical protein